MVSPGEPHAATAFISYAQSDPQWSRAETEKWVSTVLRFAVLLCEMGVDTDLDQFHAHSANADWDRFGAKAIQAKELILLAVSRAYRERWEGVNEPGTGAGAVREANVLMGLFDEDQDNFRARLKVVVLPGATETDIPTGLRGVSCFRITELSEAGLEDLYRMLTNQPATPKPPTGSLKTLSARPLQSEGEINAIEDAEQTAHADTAGRELADLRIEIERLGNTLDGIPEIDMIQARRGNFSLPWVRTAYELDQRHQALLVRYGELEAAASQLRSVETGEIDEDALQRLLAEIFAAAGWSPSNQVVVEVARRLMAPDADPETLKGLFNDLPGRDPEIGVVKNVLYDLMQNGILERNPDERRGWIIGRLPRGESE